MNAPKLGILVGGGPAPGINSVIHAATIEACNRGQEVLGIYDGFKYLMQSKVVHTPLTIASVSRIHLEGGSIVHTARANPTRSTDALRACATALAEAGIAQLIGIGGDDTAFSLYRVARYAQEEMGYGLQVVHVPKTIDNDLPLPEGIPTFGFESARETGTRIVMTIMQDALTSQNWFLVVTMGRKAGHLALAIGKSSGATLTIIPEEWRGQPVRLQQVVDIVVTSILRRRAEGKQHGVALVAEGILEYMAEEDLKSLADLQYDEHGHIRMEEINLADMLKDRVSAELKRIGLSVGIRDKDLGYELRCVPPMAFDIDYTRSLGQAAVDFLAEGGTNATITLQHNRAVPMPFEEMMDAATGRMGVRMVDVESFTYRSAQRFMIRFTADQAGDTGLIERMAAQARLSPEEFRARYGYLAGIAPRPY